MLKNLNNSLTFCSADETTLKTIVRANPGYLLLKNGTIERKWSWAGIPAAEKLSGYFSGRQTVKIDNKNPLLIVYSSGLSVIVLLLLISSFFRAKQGSSEG